MRKCADRFIQNNTTMVDDFLELRSRLAALMCSKIGFTSHINRIQVGPVVTVNRRQTKLIRSSGPKNLQGLWWVCTAESQFCAQSGQVIELYDGVLRKPLAQIISQGLRLGCIP